MPNWKLAEANAVGISQIIEQMSRRATTMIEGIRRKTESSSSGNEWTAGNEKSDVKKLRTHCQTVLSALDEIDRHLGSGAGMQASAELPTAIRPAPKCSTHVGRD